MQTSQQNKNPKPKPSQKTKHGQPLICKLELPESSSAMLQNPGDILSKIFSFNSVVGKGIILCLQNQYSLSQMILDLVQAMEEEKSSSSFEHTSFSCKFGQRKVSRVEEALSSNDTFSFPLGPLGGSNKENKDKRIGFIASKVESFMGDLSKLLKIEQEPVVIEQQNEEEASRSPVKLKPKWKQENKRTSVPIITNNTQNQKVSNDPYLPYMKKMRKNSNFIDDRRRTVTDNSFNKTSKTPLSMTTENLTFDSKDGKDNKDKDANKKREISVNESKTPKVTLKLGTSAAFSKSKERIRTNPSPTGTTKPLFNHQVLKDVKDMKDIYPSREGTPSNKPHTTPKKQTKQEKNSSSSLTSFSQENIKPVSTEAVRIRRPSPVGKSQEETVVEKYGDIIGNLGSQNSSMVMTLMDDTERVIKPSDLEDDSSPLCSMISGTGNVSQMEKKIIKGILEEESRESGLMLMTGKAAFSQHSQEKRNVINAKWMRAWKEYVGFDSGNDINGALRMSGYNRPGKILNRGLLRYDVINDLGALTGDLELKENLLEHHDYEVVSKRIFETLAKWYGCDFEIVRNMRVDPFKRDKPYLDLYPEGEMMIKCPVFQPKGSSPQYSSNSNSTKSGSVLANIINTNLSGLGGFQGVKKGLR